MFVWMWKGPAKTPPGLPSKIELLSRMLKILLEIEHDWSVAASVRKNVNQRLRAALSASDYSSYRTALSTMDEAVAGTIKRLVERAGGLSDAVRGNMLDLLRENFFSLFVKAKIDPWLDENAIWTTEAALRKREDELKELVEIRMLENARAIGAAAEHGDLSENSEWKFAIEERDMLRARAAKLQEEITMARVLRPEAITTQTVGIGSSVTLRHEGNGQQVTLTFLGPWDSDVTKGLFSYQTPLGQDLMGKQIGDTVHIKMESIEGQYIIEKIAAGLK
jgi:transcription elongation factor GreA